jgi:hypothetical protein
LETAPVRWPQSVDIDVTVHSASSYQALSRSRLTRPFPVTVTSSKLARAIGGSLLMNVSPTSRMSGSDFMLMTDFSGIRNNSLAVTG